MPDSGWRLRRWGGVFAGSNLKSGAIGPPRVRCGSSDLCRRECPVRARAGARRSAGRRVPRQLKEPCRAKTLLESELFMKPDPAVAVPSIMRSNDKEWLTGFRARILDAGVPEIVAAIDRRLSQLGDISLRSAIQRPLGDLTLVERVHEAVRVYEQFLAHEARRQANCRVSNQSDDQALGREGSGSTNSHEHDHVNRS